MVFTGWMYCCLPTATCCIHRCQLVKILEVLDQSVGAQPSCTAKVCPGGGCGRGYPFLQRGYLWNFWVILMRYHKPAFVAEWENHCATVWPAWLSSPRGPEFKSGPGGLSVYVGQLSAYSENNISGKHRGCDGVLFNLWPLTNAGFRDTLY